MPIGEGLGIVRWGSRGNEYNSFYILVHAFNSSTRKEEPEGSPVLKSKFKDSQSYKEESCIEKGKEKKIV